MVPALSTRCRKATPKTTNVESRKAYLLMQMIITTLMRLKVIDTSIPLRTKLAVERLPRFLCRFGLDVTRWVSGLRNKVSVAFCGNRMGESDGDCGIYKEQR